MHLCVYTSPSLNQVKQVVVEWYGNHYSISKHEEADQPKLLHNTRAAEAQDHQKKKKQRKIRYINWSIN